MNTPKPALATVQAHQRCTLAAMRPVPAGIGVALLATSVALGASVEPIYSQGFEGPVGLEWSTSATAVTPVGNRRFLGEFGNEAVTLRLSNLPAHNHLTVSFELLAIRTWDGNRGGPDVWKLEVVDGPVLLDTTLSVPLGGFYRWQAYPGNRPGSSYPAGTAAAELNTLGYLYQGSRADMVLRPTLTFPHVAGSVTLRFSGANLQAIADESWGIDNVRVTTGSAPRVSFTSPDHEAGFTAPASVILAADARDDDGVVTQVEFFADGKPLGSAGSAPYFLPWPDMPPGIHELVAVATDDGGVQGRAYATIYVNGLRATYFQNSNFSGGTVNRQDPFVNFDWGNGRPLEAIGADTFSVRWTGYIVPRFSEVYTFETLSDDGVRLWVNGQRIIDNWSDHDDTIDKGQIALAANVPVPIMLHFYDDTGAAIIRLRWSSASQPIEVVPQTQLQPPPPGVNQRPTTPLISKPFNGGVSVTPETVAMSCSAFWDADVAQTHVATDWEILTATSSEKIWASLDARGALRTTNHLAGGVFLGSHAGRTGLLPDTDYVLRVRHRDSSGDPATEWSNPGERYFNTYGSLAPHFRLLAKSEFSVGDEGWRVTGNGNWTVPRHESEGFLSMQDQVAGAWSWVAPVNYLGNQAAAYQGFLEFEQRQSDSNVGGTDSQPAYADLILLGGGRQLVLNLSNDPGTNWTHYRIRLDEKSGWRLDSITGVAPTRSDFIEVLSAMTSVQIRGDYSTLNTDVTGLENVALFAGPASVGPALRITMLVSGAVAIEWPAETGARQLQTATSLPTTAWLDVPGEPQLTAGIFRIVIQPADAAAFYRFVAP